MNKFIVIAICLFFLGGCNKEESVQRKMTGTWSVVYYRFTDPQGFHYFPEVEGSIFFENCTDYPCVYSLGISYTHPQLTGTRNEVGTYTLRNHETFDLVKSNGNGTSDIPLTHTILLISKSDLQFHYADSLGNVHQFVCEK